MFAWLLGFLSPTCAPAGSLLVFLGCANESFPHATEIVGCALLFLDAVIQHRAELERLKHSRPVVTAKS
jgi:hypothetical protein